jgi:hypothetical protein
VDKRSASTISLAAGMLLVGGQPNLELLRAEWAAAWRLPSL